MNFKNRNIESIAIVLAFIAINFIVSGQIQSHATNSVISEGYSIDKSVKWTVTDDGTMTIVPVNGKEGIFTTSCFDESGNTKAVLPDGYIFGHAFMNNKINQSTKNIGDSVKKIIANQGTIHVLDAQGLFGANSNVGDQPSLYGNEPSLTYADLTAFDTTKCERFDNMFMWQNKLEEVKVGPKFKGTSSVNFENMFKNCKALKKIPWLTDFDMNNGIDFWQMFDSAGLEEIDLSNFDITTAMTAILNTDYSHHCEPNLTAFLYNNDNLMKITFGQKCLGRITESTDANSGKNGFPFAARGTLRYRNRWTLNTWTRSDGKYKNLSYDDMEAEFTKNPSFLIGTWIRDDALTQYNVTFTDGYIKNIIATKSASEGSNITKNDFPTAKSYISDGIKFEGWFDDNNNDCSNGIKNITKNMTITAKYRPYLITAKFVLDDGSEAHVNMNTAYRTRFTLPKYTGKVPTKKEFVFWSTKTINGSHHLLHENEPVDVSTLVKCPTDDNETITFTAVFTNINTNNNQNTNNNSSNNNATNTISNTNTNTNTNTETKAVTNTQSAMPQQSQQPQQQSDNSNDLVQTGIETITLVMLTVTAITVIALITRKRIK